MAEALANQLDKLQIHDKIANMKQVEILTDILTNKEERSDVVVFGEGDFTFSMALASCRGSWDGITSTRYEPISDEHPKPDFSDVMSKTRKACKGNGKQFDDGSYRIQAKVKRVEEMQCPPRPDDTWQFGVDATCIPEELNVRGKVAWFQCPWETQTNKIPSKKTGQLVAAFLKHMALKQTAGDYALVGIVNEKQCVEQYKLQELLGEDLHGPVHYYQFLGADKKFVRKLLQYGYHYKGHVGDHKSFLNDHITLVFCRKIRIYYKLVQKAIIKMKYTGVNHLDMLRNLLVGTQYEERSDVVVFGEGDFTFSMALASCHGSWDGITSTRYEPISDEMPRPAYSDVKEKTLRYSISNGRLFSDASDVILSKAEKVLSLGIPPDGTWQFDVDATSIPRGLKVRRKVVWFQCPWVIRTRAYWGSNTGKLVADFLEHMSSKQRPDDYALVGIVNLSPYVSDYNLHRFLGEDLAQERAYNYKFLGADQIFVRELLQYGYHHQGYYDCHKYFAKHHITLVFLRTE